jgi:tetratricopeptide (TPR) repeat protein
MSRLLDFYLATAAGVYAIERPGDRLVEHLATTHQQGLQFSEGTSALDWLYSEAAPLLACVAQAAGTPRLRQAVDLLWAAKDLTESGANSRQYEATAEVLCEAARDAGDAQGLGRARTTLTNVLLVSGRISSADQVARLAMESAQSANDGIAISWVANDRGLIALHQHRYEDGKTHFTQAIDGYRATGNRLGEAVTLANLSRAYLGMGEVVRAVEIAQSALAIHAQLGRPMRRASAHYALGIALSRANRHVEALQQFSEALTIFTDHRQRLWEGVTHFRVAEVHLQAGRASQAAQHAEHALTLGCIGGDVMRGRVLTLIGQALTALRQIDRAQACWVEALTLFEQTGAKEAVDVRVLLASRSAM